MILRWTSSVIRTLLIVTIVSGCNFEKQEEIQIWPPPKNKSNSFEIINRDTCNRLVYGYKQGLWYLLDSAKLRTGKRVIKDTLYYRNDTVIEN